MEQTSTPGQLREQTELQAFVRQPKMLGKQSIFKPILKESLVLKALPIKLPITKSSSNSNKTKITWLVSQKLMQPSWMDQTYPPSSNNKSWWSQIALKTEQLKWRAATPQEAMMEATQPVLTLSTRKPTISSKSFLFPV